MSREGEQANHTHTHTQTNTHTHTTTTTQPSAQKHQSRITINDAEPDGWALGNR